MNASSNDQGWGSPLVTNNEQPAHAEAVPGRPPSTPDSPDWEHGVRLSACPTWCDGTHELIVNARYADGQLLDADAIHSSPAVFVPDEKADVRGDGMPLYLEQHPDGSAPGGSEPRYVVCGDDRLTPASARVAAGALLKLALLAETSPARTKSVAQPFTCPEWCTTSEEAHTQDDPGRPLHTGPVVAGWAISQLADEPVLGYYYGEEYATAEQLREIAANALKVADWIEANQ